MKWLFKSLPFIPKPKALPSWQARVDITIPGRVFTVQTAKTPEQISQALDLRHQVFYEELCGRSHPDGTDMDEFDPDSDHLVIVENSTQKIVGTYRLRSSLFTQKFYSATEFEIAKFVRKQKGPILEIGRACIAQDYRKGSTLSLLWKGIAEYARRTDSKFLFGCSSISETDPVRVQALIEWLIKEGVLQHKFKVRPHHSLFPFAVQHGVQLSEEEITNLIPPLLRSYIKAGAVLYGMPTVDEELECVDFFTCLEMGTLVQRYSKKYSAGQKQGLVVDSV